MTASVAQVYPPRDARIRRIMEGRKWKSEDERDAMVYALYKFSDQDFDIVWRWYRDGGEV